MTLWVKHTKAERIALLQRAEEKFHINQLALEKDCWVTMVLNALFKCSCSKELIFKGGTSLSKGWNLIERFSEDIDLSVNHTFFGIEKTTKNQREKLRKKARRYILDVISNELEDNLKSMGIKGFRIENVEETIDASEEETVMSFSRVSEGKRFMLILDVSPAIRRSVEEESVIASKAPSTPRGKLFQTESL